MAPDRNANGKCQVFDIISRKQLAIGECNGNLKIAVDRLVRLGGVSIDRSIDRQMQIK